MTGRLGLSRRALLAGLGLPALTACNEGGGPVSSGASGMAEQVLRIPVPAEGGGAERVELEATLFRPAGPGPFPLLVMNHGQPASFAQFRTMERERFPLASRLFVEEGYAVLLPMRRGFGNSGGAFRGGTGPCGALNPLNGADVAADDIEAVRTWAMTNLPFLDSRRTVLAGQSAGGYGSMSAGSRAEGGVAGVINFAGGLRAGSTVSTTGSVQLCDGWQDAVAESFEAMGRRPGARGLPTLWLYAVNDSFFGYGLGRRFSEAYVRGGGRARFVELPSIGRDGHSFIRDPASVSLWGGSVRTFLADLRGQARA